MDNYSLSDLAAVTKDADGWGGNGGVLSRHRRAREVTLLTGY